MSGRNKIDRRRFMGAAAPFALAMPLVLRKDLVFGRGDYGPEDLAHTRQTLLAMVNRERAQHGLSRLELDYLASKVATDHARDMVDGLFLTPLPGEEAVDLRRLPKPSEIRGIEFFAGPAMIPVQYSGVGRDKWCGLIAVWTK